MILADLSKVPNYNDVVIIGSGPAGLSIALHLEKKGISSIVIEAGKSNPDQNSQNFYKGKIVGDDFPDLSICRLRQFGGTTGHWGGTCIELDEYDFESWPINKVDLKKFKKESYKNLNIEGNFFKKKFNQNIDIINYNWSNARFKEKYFEKIKKSKKIALILNCPFIQFNGENGKVISASVYKVKLKNVEGKYFILAAGGIENSRLLLWSRHKNKTLINKNLPIGNYWMDHPYHQVAEGVLFKKNFVDYLTKNNLNKYIDMNCNYSFPFSPNLNFLNEFEVLNTSINIGIFKNNKKTDENIFLKQLKCLAPSIINKYFFDKDYYNNYNFSVSLLSDQKPEYSNRIDLGDEKDVNGIPIPVLYWKRSENVRDSSRKIVENLASFLISKNLGRLAAEEFLFNDMKYNHMNGYHHMGGTRMGNNNKYSVVDKNLKVHDTKNLYISGSSVFVTAGHAHPTLTLTQLAIRLADHLSKLIN